MHTGFGHSHSTAGAAGNFSFASGKGGGSLPHCPLDAFRSTLRLRRRHSPLARLAGGLLGLALGAAQGTGCLRACGDGLPGELACLPGLPGKLLSRLASRLLSGSG